MELSLSGLNISDSPIRFVDFFCGIGGGRLGFESACQDVGLSSECIMSCDIKKTALHVYNTNFNEKNEIVDINKIDEKTMEDFDVLLAGFPCQPFSSAGNKMGFKDDMGRGILFLEIIRILKEKHPKLVILENVENLENHDNGKTMKIILQHLRTLGYKVSYKVLNSFDYGIPQSRKRIFIVASEKEFNLNNIPTSPKIVMKDIIDNQDNISLLPKKFLETIQNSGLSVQDLKGKSIKDKRGGIDNIHSWDLAIFGKVDDTDKFILNQLLLERRKKHWAVLKKIKWMDGMPLTLDEITTFINNIPRDDLQKRLDRLVDINYLRKEKPKDIVNGKREYVENGDEGYNINKGKLSFPVTKILSGDDICPTLTATDACKLAIVTTENILRQLNKKELKLVCGFPDNFDTNDTKISDLYDLFGNTICPPVMKALAKFVIKNL